MQEKITYLILQFSYQNVELALYQSSQQIECQSIHKYQVTGQLIPHIQTMLQTYDLYINTIDFIGVNAGPGPYNTLRAMIATCNGLHMGQNFKLVQTNTFQVLRFAYADKPLLAVFDAFGNHVYYSTHHTHGYCHVNDLAQMLDQQQYYIVGNGIAKVSAHIQASAYTHIVNQEQLFCSINHTAELCRKNYNNNQCTDHLEPLYLKHAVKQQSLPQQS